MLANYIYDECIGFSKKSKITILIKSDFQADQQEVKRLIHSYFCQELKEREVLNHYAYMFHSIILFFGFLCIFLAYSTILDFFHEILLILGWLSIWEVVYDIIFVNGKDKIKNERYKKLSNVSINFQ